MAAVAAAGLRVAGQGAEEQGGGKGEGLWNKTLCWGSHAQC